VRKLQIIKIAHQKQSPPADRVTRRFDSFLMSKHCVKLKIENIIKS
jgi:hypothetical protein